MSKHSESLWPTSFLELGSAPGSDTPVIDLIARELALPNDVAGQLVHSYAPLASYCAARVEASPYAPLVVGINGAQGTGKSTAAHILQHLLQQQFDLSVCQISIDDLYLSHASRQKLAQQVHPLLATRGVPGTHDLSLAIDVFAQLSGAQPGTQTMIPRFNKAADDRCPPEQWDIVVGRPQVIIFEGWCVGARAQRSSDLAQPVNALEAEEDGDGAWREFVNQRLREYQQLFDKLNLLVMLKAPSFDQVLEWRQLQEQKLRETLSTEELAHSRVMTATEIERFIAHYERLTRWMLQEMPARADILLSLQADHSIATIDSHITQ
ncbi:phosphoribulokinase [Gilvimarinus agarilyticus]|uniref:phosphoribulokinase n=1 Tax=Gilvimarinus agarilyticus TaxID=679259 RepID=UPI000B0D44CC|nr:phosphoribulokinase [Gilvimarinus agarilyticus]